MARREEGKSSGRKPKAKKLAPEPISFVICGHCGNEQADMGRNVLCERCDEPIS